VGGGGGGWGLGNNAAGAACLLSHTIGLTSSYSPRAQDQNDSVQAGDDVSLTHGSVPGKASRFWLDRERPFPGGIRDTCMTSEQVGIKIRREVN